MNAVLEEALRYHARGWSIIPMQMAEKRPACRGWKSYQTARADKKKIRRWFPNGSQRGVAVVFGAVSGELASRDFDDLDTYNRWATAYPDLAQRLPTVETRRGRHVYCRVDPANVQQLRNDIGKPNGIGAIDCGDAELRVGACYSVLPPSTHPSGHEYAWLIPLLEGPLPVVDLMESGLFLPPDWRHLQQRVRSIHEEYRSH